MVPVVTVGVAVLLVRMRLQIVWICIYDLENDKKSTPVD